MLWPKLAFAIFGLAASLSAQTLPAGTALPIALNTTLDSKSGKPGDKLEGKLMQELLLPSGVKVKSGSHLTGHVVAVSKTAASGSRMVVQFDSLEDGHTTVPLSVWLRALAAAENVFQAKTPVDASSTYESSFEWVTKQVGGDVVFRGRGYVASNQGKVGKWSGTGVWAKLSPGGDCLENGNGQVQALWVFSTTACGMYGFEDLKILQTGSTAPLGQIALESTKDILIRSGSGWLLVVNSPADAAPAK
jgi:hypothetical protein